MRGTNRRLIIVLAAAVVAWSSPDGLAQQRSCLVKRGKIVGGTQASVANWPGQAVLRLHSASGKVSWYFCGGTAISDRWILTAAHCLPEFLSTLTGPVQDSKGAIHTGQLEVLLEADDLTTAPAQRAYVIDRVVMHETYRAAVEQALKIEDAKQRERALGRIAMSVGNDIALVRLARPWSGRKSELSLAASTDPAHEAGVQVRVAGFGMTEHNKRQDYLDHFERADKSGELYAGSSRLLETAIETVAPQVCKSRYAGDVIGPAQLCAGHEQKAKDSCQGDSGGPLVVADDDNCPRQIGVVSWGVGCADRDTEGKLYYGVYTRVSAHAEWIQRHTGPLQGATRPLASGPSMQLSVAQLEEAMTQLDDLLGKAVGRVSIGIRGGNRVKLGDKVIFEAESGVAGRLVIIDINATREVTLIYPNKFVAQGDLGRISAGARVAVPGPSYPDFTSFQAVEPVGKGRLLALVVPEDFNIERFAADRQTISKGFAPRNDPPSYLMRVIRQVEAALAARDKSASPGADGLSRWGYAVAEYEIVR